MGTDKNACGVAMVKMRGESGAVMGVFVWGNLTDGAYRFLDRFLGLIGLDPVATGIDRLGYNAVRRKINGHL